jgi:hypothetical protein
MLGLGVALQVQGWCLILERQPMMCMAWSVTEQSMRQLQEFVCPVYWVVGLWRNTVCNCLSNEDALKIPSHPSHWTQNIESGILQYLHEVHIIQTFSEGSSQVSRTWYVLFSPQNDWQLFVRVSPSFWRAWSSISIAWKWRWQQESFWTDSIVSQELYNEGCGQGMVQWGVLSFHWGNLPEMWAAKDQMLLRNWCVHPCLIKHITVVIPTHHTFPVSLSVIFVSFL